MVLAKPEAMARAVNWLVKAFTTVSISSGEIRSFWSAIGGMWGGVCLRASKKLFLLFSHHRRCLLLGQLVIDP